MSRRGRGRGRGGRGRASGWPVGTSAGALGFARSLLDDRSEPATAAVLLLSWDPAWKQIAPHGPPTRHEGEVRRCGSLNATFSKRHELLSRSGSFDAIALIHHVRSMQRGAALRQHPRAAHVMYSIEPPGWKPKLEPTHLASFTRKFDLALTYEAADRHTKAPYVKPHHGDEIFGPLLMPFEERNESALVAAIVGNCAQAGSFPRHALLEQLMKHVRVDSLGNCLHNTGSRRVPTPRVQETRALQRYKFIIAVENSVCPDYITEKALRPYRVGAIPIVFEATRDGARIPNYAQYFPAGSWINAADFDSFEALGARIRDIAASRDAWMSFHAHREPTAAVRRLDEWRLQHRRNVGDPACRLAHSALAFVRGKGTPGVGPMDRCLKTGWPTKWPQPSTAPPRRERPGGKSY